MAGLRWKWVFNEDWCNNSEKKLLDPYREQELVEVEKKKEIFCSKCAYRCPWNDTCIHPALSEKESSAVEITTHYPSVFTVNANNDCIYYENRWHKRIWLWFKK